MYKRQDLYVSWRAFRRQVLNRLTNIVLVAAVILTLILLQQLGNFFLAIAAFILITGGLLWLLSKYSEIVKGDSKAIFYTEASLFEMCIRDRQTWYGPICAFESP